MSSCRGGLMVCGTTSDAGKSTFVAGLCRLLARRGVRVAPFKAQNMANNSWVTLDGYEIGRAQAAQALAAGVEPDVAMNPVLLKPTGPATSQVVVRGRPVGHLSAAEYHRRKPELLGLVLDSLADLRARFDVVVAEGAGSPAEINLLDADIVNLRVAAEAGLPAVIVGDIDRGGVFAALYGTVGLLPDRYRSRVRGFVINKFRGDPGLLGDGLAELQRRCGVPTLGVLPWAPGLHLDAEDSLALRAGPPRPPAPPASGADTLDVAVVAWPTISNFTDLDALALEPAVGLRLVDHAGALGTPDLVILPGTKATVADLAWLRDRGLDAALAAARSAGATVLGICGGSQALGRVIDDPVESGAGRVAGLGWLDAVTTFAPDKVTRRRRGRALGQPVDGYQIHHGRTVAGPGSPPWLVLDADCGDAEPDGAADPGGAVLGTSLHGLFDADGFRSAFLARVAGRRGKRFHPCGAGLAAARAEQWDRVADLIEVHLDTAALDRILAEGAPR